MKSIDYLSIKNSKKYNKPNEDYILADKEKGIYIILDGVSRDLENNIYPYPSPASEVADILANGILKYMKNNELELQNNSKAVIKAAISKANSLIEQYNNRNGHSFLPGAVGIIAYLSKNRLHYGYIGDSIGAVINQYDAKIFTKQQTLLVRQHKSKYSKDEIRNDICNNIDHPYCYGVLNGQEKALRIVQYGSLILNNKDIVLLMTDGMENIFNRFSLSEIRSLSCQKLIEGVVELEILHSFTDDKSVIKIII